MPLIFTIGDLVELMPLDVFLRGLTDFDRIEIRLSQDDRGANINGGSRKITQDLCCCHFQRP